MKAKRSHKQDKVARLYDTEILPLWSQRFGRLLLRHLVLPPRANVLDVSCGTGFPALEVIRRMDDHGRIIAIDQSSAMLDVAREKAGALSGKRIFFRSDPAVPRLSFADDVYDVVLTNLGLEDFPDPEAAIADFARVTKPGGHVLVTLPLEGTFAEFYDIFREVLIKRDKTDALARLGEHLDRQPTPDRARAWFARAGLVDVVVEEERFELLFKSSREFFFAPLIELGELARWKDIAGRGPEMQEIFWHIKEAIDAYFGGGTFHVTAVAGCVRARKPLDGERAATVTTEGAPPARGGGGGDDAPTGQTDLGSAQIELGTGEIEVLDDDDALDDDDPLDDE